jgi:hypothetical protein
MHIVYFHVRGGSTEAAGNKYCPHNLGGQAYSVLQHHFKMDLEVEKTY